MTFCPGSVARVRRAGLTAGIAAILFAPVGAWGGDSASPVLLPPFNVIESVLKVKVVTEYQKTHLGAFVTRMIVDEVKTPSLAQRAGLKKGMEIVAIQGHFVAGLSQAEVDQLLVQSARDSVVLLVRRSWLKQPEEIRLPVEPSG